MNTSEVVNSAVNVNETNSSESAPSDMGATVDTKAQRREKKRQAREAKAKAQNKKKTVSTSKKRVRRVSSVKCKAKRHVLIAHDKKGAEHFATGRNVTSRAAKINAILIEAKSRNQRLTTAQIREKCDALYGANEIRAISNHMYKLLCEKLVDLREGAYLLLKAPSAPKAPRAEKSASAEGAAPVSDEKTSD